MSLDRFWLWLHRYAARKAQRVYQRTPKYRDNYAAGVAAAKSKWELGIEDARARAAGKRL